MASKRRGPQKRQAPEDSNAPVALDIIASLVNGSTSLTAPEIGATLRRQFQFPVPGRTIRRWLNELVESGRIRAVGERRGRRYLPVPSESAHLEAQKPEADTVHVPDEFPPLSPEGRETLRRIQQPRAKRSPTGYDPTFLERYEPGTTSYLGENLRERLHAQGKTPDADRPAGTFAREIYHRLLIDLSWASSHLEGNTYSRLDTQRLLEFGQRAEGKDATETQMIVNHKAAIEFLVEQAEEIDFNRSTILSLHALLSENLLSNAADEGRLRLHPVGIGSSTYTPLAIPQKLEEYFELILAKERAIPDPFEQAFFAMVHLPYLQPFADVNKRTSRLSANIPLIRGNLAPLSFVDVSPRAYTDGTLAVYELNDVSLLRDVFAWAYSRSSQQYKVVRESLGQPDPFRLRYRTQLHTAVRDMIVNQLAPIPQNLQTWATANGIPPDDRAQFALMAVTLLDSLNESSAGRYRVTPNEYRMWRDRKPTSDEAGISRST